MKESKVTIYHLPEGFLWEGASSGPQSGGGSREGRRVVFERDYWPGKEPERFFSQVRPSVTPDFYHKYPEYIEKMKQAGIKSYRVSIRWSRIICDYDGKANEEGIRFYDQVISALVENGIGPMICLHHFDLPLYWMEKSGFENRETVYAFTVSAAVYLERFGDRVKCWTAFNELVIILETGYLCQWHYPAVYDAAKAAQVSYHVQLVSSLMVAEFRKGGCDGKVGIIINLTPTYCQDPDREEDRKAADTLDLIFNRSLLGPSVRGTYPQELTVLLEAEGILPKTREGNMDIIRKNTMGYLGVNCYHPREAKARTTAYGGPLMPEKYCESYKFEGQKTSRSRGWKIYEPTIYNIAMNIKENYGNIP